MKNANGSGCVSKASGKRRKPWKAIITSGREYDAEKDRVIQKRKLIGYYRTRTEAEDALSNYRQNPYDLDRNKITFREVYEGWSRIHYEEISVSRKYAYMATYKHTKPLQEMRFIDIRPYHIEKCMRECTAGSDTKNGIKMLCGLMYSYAMKSDIISINYASMCNSVKKDDPKINRAVFTPEEEQEIWKLKGELIPDMILTGLYSGWRPGELCQLECSQIDLTEWTMQGGIKTKAGKDRIVPIHDRIKPIIKRHISDGYLFRDAAKMAYRTYLNKFTACMQSLGFSHTPHDTRHTFITKGKEAGMDEHILKMIVGHSEGDITEKIYTHRRIEDLRREMAKIP